ncbi:MAG: flagellin, partial [Lachnospiraceae bacterium]|nr:flagellin [Lachnospiraceae bacterium]
MVVQSNLQAVNASGRLKLVGLDYSKSMERLSSGYQINRAADNAAGLTISERMRFSIRGLDQSSDNALDGISVVQTAEGALNEVHSILQRMNELATQAASDTNTSVDRSQIKLEIDQLASEIDRIASSTQFNTMNLLDGSFTGKNLQVGVLSGQKLQMDIYAMDTHGLGLTTQFDDAYAGDKTEEQAIQTLNGMIQNPSLYNIEKDGDETRDMYGNRVHLESDDSKKAKYNSDECLWVNSFANAGVTMRLVQNAVDVVSTQRATFGALQKRLEHTIANLDNTQENTQFSESRLRDTDMSREMVKYRTADILQRSGQAM